jgi:SPP1 gp7 family putative phage head morphogenesis protein
MAIITPRRVIVPDHKLVLQRYRDAAIAQGKRASTIIKQKMLLQVKSGKKPDVTDVVVKALWRPMRDMMVVAHLASMIKQRQRAPKELALSIIDQGIKQMKNSLNASKEDIDAITKRYGTLSAKMLKTAGTFASDKLQSTMHDLLSSGATKADAVDVLSDRINELGLTPENDYVLETLYKTSESIATGAGTWNAYQDKDIQEILWGYYYSAVGDDRTRPNHEAADETTLPKDHEFWETMWPPNGWNCRCTVIALYDPEDEVEPGADAYPDEGWGFNPGIVMGGVGADGEEGEEAEGALPLAYDPNQPRDEHGRWTSGGGGSSAAQNSTRESSPLGETHAARISFIANKFPGFNKSKQFKIAAINHSAPTGVIYVPKALKPAEIAQVQKAFPSHEIKAIDALKYIKEHPPDLTGTGRPTPPRVIATPPRVTATPPKELEPKAPHTGNIRLYNESIVSSFQADVVKSIASVVEKAFPRESLGIRLIFQKRLRGGSFGLAYFSGYNGKATGKIELAKSDKYAKDTQRHLCEKGWWPNNLKNADMAAGTAVHEMGHVVMNRLADKHPEIESWSTKYANDPVRLSTLSNYAAGQKNWHSRVAEAQAEGFASVMLGTKSGMSEPAKELHGILTRLGYKI